VLMGAGYIWISILAFALSPSMFNRTHKWVCTMCYAKLKASEASEIKVWRHTNLGSL
jgi:hypothetical protein